MSSHPDEDAGGPATDTHIALIMHTNDGESVTQTFAPINHPRYLKDVARALSSKAWAITETTYPFSQPCAAFIAVADVKRQVANRLVEDGNVLQLDAVKAIVVARFDMSLFDIIRPPTGMYLQCVTALLKAAPAVAVATVVADAQCAQLQAYCHMIMEILILLTGHGRTPRHFKQLGGQRDLPEDEGLATTSSGSDYTRSALPTYSSESAYFSSTGSEWWASSQDSGQGSASAGPLDMNQRNAAPLTKEQKAHNARMHEIHKKHKKLAPKQGGLARNHGEGRRPMPRPVFQRFDEGAVGGSGLAGPAPRRPMPRPDFRMFDGGYGGSEESGGQGGPGNPRRPMPRPDFRMFDGLSGGSGGDSVQPPHPQHQPQRSGSLQVGMRYQGAQVSADAQWSRPAPVSTHRDDVTDERSDRDVAMPLAGGKDVDEDDSIRTFQLDDESFESLSRRDASSHNDAAPVNKLPDDVLIYIFSLFEPAELANAGLACRRWYMAIMTDALWKQFYRRALKRKMHMNASVSDSLAQVDERGLNWYEAYMTDFAPGLTDGRTGPRFTVSDRRTGRTLFSGFGPPAGAAITEHGTKVRVLIVGDNKSGKSALSMRFCTNSFNPEYTRTNEFRMQSRRARVQGVELCFELWEVADVQRHSIGIFHYMRHCDAVVCVCDPRNALSVQHCKDWFDFIGRIRDDTSMVKVMVNTFADQSKERVAARPACMALASECGASYHECSSVTGIGVEKIFLDMSKSLAQRGPERIRKLFARHGTKNCAIM